MGGPPMLVSVSTRFEVKGQRVRGSFAGSHTAAHWGKSFVQELWQTAVKEESLKLTPSLNTPEFFEAYKNAKNRLVVIDYDSSLVPVKSIPSMASPTHRVYACLSTLAKNPRNQLILHSGRRCTTMMEWFINSGAWLSAEHGFFLKPPNEEEWRQLVPNLDVSWMHKVMPLLNYFTERTPGTSVEEREVYVVWNYKNADPEFGSQQAHELLLQLDSFFEGRAWMSTHDTYAKSVLIKPQQINVNSMLKKYCSQRPDIQDVDFVLYMGDGNVESALSEFNPSARTFTCVVSMKSNVAMYHLENSRQAKDLLVTLSKAE